VSAYRNDLGQFSTYLKLEMCVQSWPELSDDHLTSYLLYLRERKYANSTVARKVAAVKSFCHYLIDQGVIRHDPASTLPSPKVDKFVPRAVSLDEMMTLLDHCAQTRTPEGLRDRAMLEALYATGMRVSELTSLDLDDLDVAQSQVRCGSRPERERWIPLTPQAAEAIDEYLKIGRPLLRQDPRETAIFLNHRGKRLTRQGFWLILKAHAEAAQIEGNITPHTIRHTFAAHALRQGQELRDIQRILGHMSISTTQVYQQVAQRVGGLREAAVLVAAGSACYDSGDGE
jgi:integrase/recombinase XerD